MTDPESNRVFVAYGHHEAFNTAMFHFLRSIGLIPYEWEQMVADCGTSPYIGDVLESGMAASQAFMILLTGDDLASIRPELWTNETADREKQRLPQPRPNVLLEAGMALAKYQSQTILVEHGSLRGVSDLLGRHVVKFDGSPKARNTLCGRLRTAGCVVDTSGNDWLNVPFPSPFPRPSPEAAHQNPNAGPARTPANPTMLAIDNLLLLMRASNHALDLYKQGATPQIACGGRYIGADDTQRSIYNLALERALRDRLVVLAGVRGSGSEASDVYRLTATGLSRSELLIDSGSVPDWRSVTRNSLA